MKQATTFIFLLLLAIFVLFLVFYEYALGGSYWSIISSLFSVILLVTMGFALFSFYQRLSLRTRRLMIVVFLFVPLLFAFIYFSEAQDKQCLNRQSDLSIIDYFYFSFVTLATLGYGDLAPVGACRTLAVIEAMFGFAIVPISIAFVFHDLRTDKP